VNVENDQESVSRGMAFLRNLMDTGANVDSFLEAHPDVSSPTLADDLHALSGEALVGGQLDTAKLAAVVGGSLNLRLGREVEALQDREMMLQVDYQRAESPDQYEQVRESFLELGDRADELGEARRALRARCFAIQSGYFGSEAADEPQEQERWVRRALDDLIRCLEAQEQPMSAENATFLMDFAFAPLDLATARVWMETEIMSAVLAKVSSEIDVHIPLDAPLSSDPERDAAIAVVLARLPSTE
jgi:hypothetical protein